MKIFAADSDRVRHRNIFSLEEGRLCASKICIGVPGKDYDLEPRPNIPSRLMAPVIDVGIELIVFG